MQIRKILFGAATFIPGLNLYRMKTTGGSNDPLYCYSVWMRHLSMLAHYGMDTNPSVVAEIGPGDSLGIGLMALLTGSDRYIALDAVEFADMETSRTMLGELVKLINERADIASTEAYKKVKPKLDSYSFPVHILGEDRIGKYVLAKRAARIDATLAAGGGMDSIIEYRVPWSDAPLIEVNSVDLIFSQAVLEHVIDLPVAYAAMYSWCRPGGVISHQIDFKCHGTTDEWNGHWVVKDWLWRILKGRRPYLLNREPWSKHKQLLEDVGFSMVGKQLACEESVFTCNDLNPRFRHVTADDLVVAGAYFVARLDNEEIAI